MAALGGGLADTRIKALVLGSAMIDTIAIIASELIEHLALRNAETSFLLLEAGRKTEALEISTHCGGGGLNVAVAMARLGIETAALVKLGDDARADTICRQLETEGVATDWVVRDDREPTGAAVHLSSHDRDAAIFTFRGANTLLKDGDLKDAAFDVDLVYISSLSDESADCFPLIVEKARARGAMVAANPGIRQLSARAGAFLDSLDKIDVLTLNRVEADTLVPGLASRTGGMAARLDPPPDRAAPALVVRGFASEGFVLSFAGFFRAAMDLGPRYVVVTDGGNGAFVGSQGRIVHCPIAAAEVAGTAGAGDAFAATLTAFIASGRSVDEAMRAAAVNAASVVTRIDAEGGLLDRAEVERRAHAQHSKLPLKVWTLA
jgi:ribokinase